MSTPQLPTHIGGLQHLAPDTICKEGDIYVDLGKPAGFVSAIGYGMSAQDVELATGYNIYRRIPVAKQGDCDPDRRKRAAAEPPPAFKMAKDGTKLWRSKDGSYSPSGFMDDGPNELETGAAGAGCEATNRVTAPLRATGALPSDAKARKGIPIYSGFIKYFPLAIAEVARVSQAGNDQHNPGKPLHWDRSKSGDELDALGRHFLEAEKFDTDGQRHAAKIAWRAMANLQKELEEERK